MAKPSEKKPKNDVTFTPLQSPDCFPKCTWDCGDKSCDEECKPFCEPPECTTRCDGMNISLCHMECQKPHCAVICPKKVGPKSLCTTSCSPAVCKMKCDEKKLPCHSFCKKPKCKWFCKAPEKCKKPKCKLTCIKPPPCLNSTKPEKPGHTESSPAPAPDDASLLQVKPGELATMRVPITRMLHDMTIERTHVELPIKHASANAEDGSQSHADDARLADSVI